MRIHKTLIERYGRIIFMEWFVDLIFLDFFQFLAYKYNFLYIVFLFILFEICSSINFGLEMSKHEVDRLYEGREELSEDDWIAEAEAKRIDHEGFYKTPHGIIFKRHESWPTSKTDWFYWVWSKLVSLLFAFLSAVIMWHGIIRFTSLICIGDKCF